MIPRNIIDQLNSAVNRTRRAMETTHNVSFQIQRLADDENVSDADFRIAVKRILSDASRQLTEMP